MGPGQAFYPQGLCVLTNLTSAASAAICPSTFGGLQSMRLVNISTGPNIFVTIAQTTATAVLPLSSAASTGTNSFPLLQNQETVVSCPPNSWVSALTTGAGLVAILAAHAGWGKR